MPINISICICVHILANLTLKSKNKKIQNYVCARVYIHRKKPYHIIRYNVRNKLNI